MKRRILIVANPNSIWTKAYIENVLFNEPFEVFLLSYDKIKPEFGEFYKDSGVRFVLGSGATNRLKRLFEIFRVRFFLRPEFIHVMFVTINACKLVKLMSNNYSKVVLSYMGSDIFRMSIEDAPAIYKYLSSSFCVTLPSEKAERRFKEVFSDSTMCVFDGEFGDSVLDRLELLDIDQRVIYRKEFGFDNNAFVIHLGYNGSQAQNHIEIMKQISKIDKRIKEYLYIVCHVSYGVTNMDYLDKLRRTAETMGCRFLLFDKFLTYEEIARFRMCADCFINAQTTDDYSVSLIEYLYVGCCVINANWLKYERLENIGVKYTGFDNFNEIPQIIVRLVNKTDLSSNVRIKNYQTNRALIKNIYSWNSCRKLWLSIYDGEGNKYREG